MPTISDDERRARLAVRHHLATRAPDVETVAADLVGLHSSDPASVFLASWARVRGFAVDDLEAALYEQRSLVRMLGMRRTMFVVPRRTAAVMDAACTKGLLPGERKRMVRMLEEQGVTPDGSAWIDDVLVRTLAALGEAGEATANELREVVPELKEKLTFGEGKKWGGQVGISTRMLFLLATAGRIVRGRPLGTWLSSQYRWATTANWLGEDLEELDPAEARADLLRLWLKRFGPGTLTDIKWWTGWTVRDTRSALAAVGAVEAGLDEGTGFLLAGDLDATASPAPWVALLPALDSTVMGWKERAWFLGDHEKALFDRNGNAGPTVWCDGRVVGGWGQRADGTVAVKLLEPVGGEPAEAIEAERDRLESWLGDVRVTPRFRTPIDKELSARSP